MLRRHYYNEMKRPVSKGDMCTDPDCKVRYESLIPLFEPEFPYARKGLICGWCGEVYLKEDEDE